MFEHKRDYTKRKKQLKSIFYQTRRQFLSMQSNADERKTILFYPQYPSWRTTIHKSIMYLGLDVTNDPGQYFDMMICWEDRTFRQPNDLLKSLVQHYPALNRSCVDVSKEKIAEIFRQTFQYEVATNPQNHSGYCVKKSNYNSWHDGEIIECPIASKKLGFAYQKLLHNLSDSKYHQDYRVPVVCDYIPFVSPRFHDKNDRFNKVVWAEYKPTEDIFSKEEVRCILQFCRILGLDYGELDIIRDNFDARIYIVDANHTPCFPSRKITSKDDRMRMIEANAKALNTILEGIDPALNEALPQ